MKENEEEERERKKIIYKNERKNEKQWKERNDDKKWAKWMRLRNTIDKFKWKSKKEK